MNRTRVVVVVAVALVAAGGVAAAAQVARSGPSAVEHVYPEPGSIAAAPGTSITVRGISAKKIGTLTVKGSQTGTHAGSLALSRDGDGATFTPKAPFKEGEKVTVRTNAKVAGASHKAYSFTVAHHAEPAAAKTLPTPPASGPYRTRPEMDPPAVKVDTTGVAFNGLLASAPDEGASGLLLSDQTGQPVWFKPATPGHTVGDLHVATFHGKQVLVYFDGTEGFGPGNYRGSWHILNSAYQQIATMSAGNGASADLHDILLRSDGTAIVESYDPVVMDMRKYGGKARATVLDCEIQQIDVATGDVLFEWHSLDHLAPSESYADLTGSVVDYFHANTLAADPQHPNNIIVSARHLSQVFSLSLKTGKIGWRVGGKHPTLHLAKGAVDTVPVGGKQIPFSYQHDARIQSDGTLTVYDNGNQRKPGFSRMASFTLDLGKHTVTENNGAEIRHKPDLYGDATGDARKLPNGDTFISWGTTGHATEYDADKHVVAEITTSQTYRMFNADWHGAPVTRPSVATAVNADSQTTVYVSWNGATDVASWQVVSGPDATHLKPVTTAKRDGFETAIALPGDANYVQVQALNASGTVIGTSISTQILRP
jgi:hypothetical protein